MELLATFIGAVVGGSATFVASWWQTKRVLAHERQQARDAAEEERQGARNRIAQSAALELLSVLALADEAIPMLGPGRPPIGAAAPSVDLLGSMRHAQIAIVPVLPDDLRRRFGHLRTLLGELRSASPEAVREVDYEATVAPSEWTQPKLARARDDVASYLRYVHRSTVAVIDSTPLPTHAEMPYLRRQDMAVWQAPDQPYYVGNDDG